MSSHCGICKSVWDTYGVFISCFGCSSIFHTKCVKVKATVADVLKCADTNGLQWFCGNCRKMSPSVLITKLSKCTETAETLKAATTKLMDLVAAHNAEIASLRAFTEDVLIAKPTDTLLVAPARRTRSASCNSLLQASDVSGETPIDQPPPAVVASSPPLMPDGSADPIKTVDASSSVLPHKVLLKTVTHVPRKSIFLSRLAASTSVRDILSYIMESCSVKEADVFCRKFEPASPREIASFKIVPPVEFFDELLQGSFWPPGTLVREFKPRQSTAKKFSPVVIGSKN